MSRQLLGIAVAASAGVLITTGAGFAQTGYYRSAAVSSAPTQSQSRYYQSYQYPAAGTLVGTYHSNDFFPSPLTLTITGADRYGNLFGSIRGMRDYKPSGEVNWQWENWGHNFNRDGSRAFYRNGMINIVFPNGATYTLANKGYMLTGTFTSKTENNPMTFIKSQGLASGR